MKFKIKKFVPGIVIFLTGMFLVPLTNFGSTVEGVVMGMGLVTLVVALIDTMGL